MDYIMLKGKEIINEALNFHYSSITDLDASTAAHCHDFYEIFFIVAGKIKHFINGQEEILDVGSLVFIRPRDIHYYKKIKATHCHMVNLAFPAETALQTICFLGQEQFGALSGTPQPPAVKLSHDDISRFLVRLENANLYNPVQTSLKQVELKTILAELLSKFHPAFHSQPDSPASEWLLALCREMQQPEHFTCGLSRLYHLAGRSPEHIARMFKKQLDMTPTQYINNLRLNYAKNLLTHSDQKIIDICYKCGFDSLSHFNHIFKAQAQMPPSRFRRVNQKNAIPLKP